MWSIFLYLDGFSISKGSCSDPKEALKYMSPNQKDPILFWEIECVHLGGPKESQDSLKRYDLTFNVWEGEEEVCFLLGDLVEPESFQVSFSSVDPSYFSITLL